MIASISKLKSVKSFLTWKRKAHPEATGETKAETEATTGALEATEIIETMATEDTEETLEDQEVDILVATANTEVMGETTRTGMAVDLPVAGEAGAKVAKSGPTATETTRTMMAMAMRSRAGAETTIAIREETMVVATTAAILAASASAQTSDQRRQPRPRAPPVQTCP